jgi:uncharacterized protein YjiS (DUF1127 family)
VSCGVQIVMDTISSLTGTINLLYLHIK